MNLAATPTRPGIGRCLSRLGRAPEAARLLSGIGWGGALIDARDLTQGIHVRGPDGTTDTVTAVRNYHRQAVTYDLTVADLHTYYVEAGTTPVLVHNDDGVVGTVFRDG